MSSPVELDLCYEGDPDLLPAREALRRIQAHIRIIEHTELVPLHAALDRILAEDVKAPLDVPNHTNAAVDGYAFRFSDIDGPDSGSVELSLQGTAYAGKPFRGTLATACAVRVMTGAVLPDGADTVIMQEQVSTHEQQVSIPRQIRLGANVRHAGEDLKAGSVVLRAGMRLLPAELGLLASTGRSQASVFRRLRVAFFSTGDELRPLGETLEPGEVFDSNRYTLFGMLSRLNVELLDLGVIKDHPERIAEAFTRAACMADVVLSSGGVSSGDADYVKQTLERLGQVGFWKIAVRPGRPLAFGRLGDAVFFGLPGNPVAVMITFYEFVLPALRRMMGEHDPRPMPLIRARCANALRKKPGRIEYYRAVLERDQSNELMVRTTGKTGSGLLHTMSDANCLIVLDEASDSVEAGAWVDVQVFFGLV